MVHPDKIQRVNALTEKIRSGQGMVFTNFKGLTVAELRELRQDLYEHQTRYHVVKNRLAHRAFSNALGNGKKSDGESPTHAPEESDRDLEDISGLGPSKAEALRDAGIESVQALLDADDETLTDISGIGSATAGKFKQGAREVLEREEGPENETGEPASDGEDEGEALMEAVEGFLHDNTAIAFSQEKFVNATETLIDFSEEHDQLVLKGGILQDRVLTEEQLETIAELPTRRELLTELARTLQAPIRRLARALNHPIQRLARITDAVRKEKQDEDET